MNRKRNSKQIMNNLANRASKLPHRLRASEAARNPGPIRGTVLKTIQIPEFARSGVLSIRFTNRGDLVNSKDYLIALPNDSSTVPIATEEWKPSSSLNASYWYLRSLTKNEQAYSPKFEISGALPAEAHFLVWNASAEDAINMAVDLDVIVLNRHDNEFEIELLKGFGVE